MNPDSTSPIPPAAAPRAAFAPRPRRGDRGPLVAGAVLLGLGAILLLEQLNLFSRVALALFPVAMFGGLAAFAFAGFRKKPETRFGLLIPAGVSISLALLIGGDVSGLLPNALKPLVFFAGPAFAFAAIWMLKPSRRWALLSAWSCAIIGITAAVDSTGRPGDVLAPLVMLVGIAACFVWHFLRTDREWALLPAGFLVTTGLIAASEGLHLREPVQVAIMFFGSSATFAVYYLLGRPTKVQWAAIPTLALAAMGFLAMFARPLVSFGVPLLLIGFGLYLILRPPTSGFPPAPLERNPEPPATTPPAGVSDPVPVSDGSDARG